MRIAIFLSFTVLAAAAPLTIPKAVPNVIARLDECIQIRFLDRKAFGMSRIAVPYHGMRVFRPENPAEMTVVDQLRQKGIEAAVYLVGQQALSPQPSFVSFPAPRTRLQGPASITLLAGTRLPDEEALFSDGKAALASIGQGAGSQTKKGEWSIAVRPLRASNQTCVQCHTTVSGAPKIGDALGVAMYVYRQRD
jgi:hypothetical protein